MNLKKLILLGFIFLFISTTLPADGKWVMKKNEAGIKVYVREVEGSELKEFKGVTFIKDITLSSLVALMRDTAAAPKWFHNCIKSRVLKKINSREIIVRNVTKAPWPVSNRDAVVYSKFSQNPKTYQITISLTGKPKFIEKTKGNIRVPSLKGYWAFIPLGKGMTKIVYQMHSDPGGSIPNWLSNSFVVDMPFNTLKNMKTMLKEKKYREAKISDIKEKKDK